MNRELVEEVKAYLRAEPRRFDMSDWVADYNGEPEEAPPCGTTCCIAGAVLMVKGLIKNEYDWEHSADVTAETAADLLGINHDHLGLYLFYYTNWSSPFREQFRQALKARDKKQQVEIACARLDYMLETGL